MLAAVRRVFSKEFFFFNPIFQQLSGRKSVKEATQEKKKYSHSYKELIHGNVGSD